MTSQENRNADEQISTAGEEPHLAKNVPESAFGFVALSYPIALVLAVVLIAISVYVS